MNQLQKKRKNAKRFISGCIALMIGIITIALFNVDNSTADGGGGGGTPLTNSPIISAGGSHTLAIVNGELYAWGRGDYGQLGFGDLGPIVFRSTSTRVDTHSNWTNISAGNLSSFAINSLGELWAWGANNNGQLGDGTTTQKVFPVQIGMGINWVSVSAGNNHSLAINSSGELYAWGHNSSYQLGDGTSESRIIPTRIGEKNNWVSISTVGNSSFAINELGELYGWGYNWYGQLGLGDTNTRHEPTRVGSETNWKCISTDGSLTFAINELGELYAWGRNDGSYLGLGGPTTNVTIPTRIGEASNWKTVTAGSGGLAINTDGELWAWGNNDYGQLGLGDTTNRNVPTRVGTGTNWVSVVISSGYRFTLAINTAGELYAWGYNSFYGQLGLGDRNNRTVPTEVIIIGANVTAPTNISGIAFSDPSITRVPIGGSYTFTATLASGYTSPIIRLTVTGKTIAKIALVSMNQNVWTYRVYDVQADITADHFTVSVSRII